MYSGHKVKVLPTQAPAVHAVVIDIRNSYWSLQFVVAVYIVPAFPADNSNKIKEQVKWNT